MRRFAVGFAAVMTVFAVSITGARATETVSCVAMDEMGATVAMNVGDGLPAVLPNWVRVRFRGEAWSTLGMDIDDGAIPVNVFQAFDDGRLMSIDLADENVTEIVIMIRVLRATEGERTVAAGTVHIPGKSVHPILCDFGESE